MLTRQEKLLELYKELGRETRQLNMETYATNRLMLPALVIGLLVLYGEVEQFLGVKIENAVAVHKLIWFGCFVISFMWIFNMSRVAQLSRWNRETAHAYESELGLIANRRLFALDNTFSPLLLRHSNLRFFGFGIYLFLLLLSFPWREIICWHLDLEIIHCVVLLLAFILSAIATRLVWWGYVGRSRNAKLKQCSYCKGLTAEPAKKTGDKCRHCGRHGDFNLLNYRTGYSFKRK